MDDKIALKSEKSNEFKCISMQNEWNEGRRRRKKAAHLAYEEKEHCILCVEKKGEKEKNDQNGIEPKTETSNSNVKRIVK